MITLEEIRDYRCPRWSSLPDLDLYMDQVMSVLEKNLGMFIMQDPQRAITPTMINNYVKHKLVRAPKNKKYDKGHIANFYIITLLKQIMSLGQIRSAIEVVLSEYPSVEEAYDRFCDIFEYSIGRVFFDDKRKLSKTDHIGADNIIMSICLAYANMLHAEYLIERIKTDG